MSQQRIESLLTEAVQRYDAGNLLEAQRLCQQVLALDPHESGAPHLLGLIAHDQGDSQKAVEFLELAVRNGPQDPDAWNDLGNVLQLCGRLQEAMQAFGT